MVPVISPHAPPPLEVLTPRLFTVTAMGLMLLRLTECACARATLTLAAAALVKRNEDGADC